jgi:hypothetical protein
MPVFGKGRVQSELDLDVMAVGTAAHRGPPPKGAGARRARAGARAADAATPAAAAAPTEPHERIPNSVGIVFVHGVGSQRPEEFLLQWTEPLLRALEAWRRTARPESLVPPTGMDIDSVERAEMDFSGESTPMITIAIPGWLDASSTDAQTPQTWVATEAWWAAAIQAPSLQAMIDWCGRRGVVARIVDAILQENGSYSKDFARRLGRLGLGLFVSTLTSFVLLSWAAMRGLAALVPITALKDAIAAKQLETFLTTWWGDVRVLLGDPAQSANIRGRLINTILALQYHGCERIVVIGHSGGTIVATMALADPAFEGLRVDTFISHGEAVNLGLTVAKERPAAEDRPGDLAVADRPGDVVVEDLLPVAGRLSARILRAGRWRDFWASRDPAPCGPLRRPEGATPEPVEDKLYNRRSIGEDHGTYWDNDEEFVIPVLRELDTAGRDLTTSRFYQPDAWRPSADETWAERRRERVYLLALWGRMTFVATVGAILVALYAGGGLIPTFAGALGTVWGWLPGHDQAEQIAALIGRPPAPVGVAVGVLGRAALGILAILGVVQVVLPIAEWSETWRQHPRLDGVVRGLDVGVPGLLGIGLAIPPLLTLIDWFRSGSPLPLAATILAILVAALFIALPTPVANMANAYDQSLGRNATLRTLAAALLVASLLVWVAATAYLLVIDGPIRSILMGAVVAVAAFQLVHRVGVWRWEVHDREERSDARLNRKGPEGRRWMLLESAVLLLITGGLAVAVAAGSLTLVGMLVIALVLGSVVVVARDAAAVGSID